MILTITLNPSVDISYNLDELNIDTVNRVNEVAKTAGGKGLNVSRVLRQLDEQVMATGYLGGELGAFISNEITKIGIQDHFIKIDEETRNCIAILHDGKQTEILEKGPVINEQEGNKFLDVFDEYVKKADIVTISGSLPKGLSYSFYLQLISKAEKYHTPVLLDTNGKLLNQILTDGAKPFLIKPNQEELAQIVNEKIENRQQIIDLLRSDIFANIPWVVITLGANGAIIKKDNDLYYAQIPKIDAINPVGSGDSVIAGFAAGLKRKLETEELIKFGLSMGVLNAMEPKTGSINPENMHSIVDQITVEQI
ncbi:Tagatose-6-phosphate kinase [Paraliobacillus sp. PM-2]|uniref:1-phosphofructokinase n=1 Tax=Paraliobacillus sp. PM-2 TaxID=1462524 RepID=UPI00061CACD4|nr:1-phosphofructokinase [Paraliobacillus sp. PM-2]CQR47134.1 Tagatose-6-phosphate kinase [Paraliobacillus sp. PM-2]